MGEVVDERRESGGEADAAAREPQLRQREGLSLAEGIEPVWQAVEAGAPVETLIYAPDLLRYQPAVEMVLDAERRGIRWCG